MRNDPLEQLVEVQSGAVTRGQALAAGLTDIMISENLDRQRWQRLHHGTYATFSGPVPRDTALWAAVLRAGDGAVLSHETAAELAGLIDGCSDPIHVTVPSSRRIGDISGVVIH